MAALALSPVLLGESRAALTRRSYDPAGAIAITGALVLLVYAVVKAPDAGWGDVRTILPLAGSALLLAAFALIESRHPAPLVPLRIFRSQHYLAADNGANPLAALAQGYQSAFLACAVLAGIGLALAFLLPGRPRKPAHELPEPDPAADAAAAGDVVIRSGTK